MREDVTNENPNPQEAALDELIQIREILLDPNDNEDYLAQAVSSPEGITYVAGQRMAELKQAKSDLRATYELIKTLEGLAHEARIFMEKRGLIDGD